jgi:hypothetical protein
MNPDLYTNLDLATNPAQVTNLDLDTTPPPSPLLAPVLGMIFNPRSQIGSQIIAKTTWSGAPVLYYIDCSFEMGDF